MEISVSYTAQLAEAAGLREEIIEAEPHVQLNQFVVNLAGRHGPRFADMILDARGDIRSTLLLVIDDCLVGKDETRTLEQNNRLTILTPIAGG